MSDTEETEETEEHTGEQQETEETPEALTLSADELQQRIDTAVAEATKKANGEAAKFRKQRDDNAAEAERLRKASEGKVDETEVQRAAREAAEQAATEYEAKMARKELEAQLYRDHGRKFQNPADALAFINLDDLPEDITLDQAVTALLDERPYLAVDETRPSGSRDAGSRTPPPEKDPGEMSVPEYREWKRKQIAAGQWAGRR